MTREARIGILGLEDTFLGDVWDAIEGNVPLAKQFGGWVNDNASIPGLIRLASAGVLTGVGPISDLVDQHVPGGANSPAGLSAKALFISAPSVIEGKGLAAAFIAESVYQLKRAGTAYVASAPFQAGLTDKAAQFFDKLPPELAIGGQRAVAFLSSAAGNEFVSNLMQRWFLRPLEDMFRSAIQAEKANLASGIKHDINVAIQYGDVTEKGSYRALEERGLSPEAIAKRTNGRPDAIATGINALSGRHLYDIDWFNAATGDFHTDPKIWANNYALAEKNGMGAGMLAEIKRRWEASKKYIQIRPRDDRSPVFQSPVIQKAATGPVGTVLMLGLLTSPFWGPQVFRRLF